MTVNIGIPANWMTTLGGIMAGIPPIILTSFMSAGVSIGAKWVAILSTISGLGALLIGVAAKDKNTHSTVAQTQKATDQVSKGELPKS